MCVYKLLFIQLRVLIDPIKWCSQSNKRISLYVLYTRFGISLFEYNRRKSKFSVVQEAVTIVYVQILQVHHVGYTLYPRRYT